MSWKIFFKDSDCFGVPQLLGEIEAETYEEALVKGADTFGYHEGNLEAIAVKANQ